MCGRFYVDEGTAGEVEKLLCDVEMRIAKKYTGDIYPSMPANILTGRDALPRLYQEGDAAGSSKIVMGDMRWGFPRYQKKGLLINARAETALERRTFCDSVRRRRCVIPAKHFYEWDAEKNKVTFFRKDSPVVYMAGFYNWFQEEGRFIILTSQANFSVSPVHDRMPLILEENELDDWIYDDSFTEYALHKTPAALGREQEYEQQSLFAADYR